MTGHVKALLTKQFEASLCMMNDCLVKCPDQHWDGKVAKYPFWQVAYHTLIFTDLYLSPTYAAFAFRDIHPGGWKEFDDEYPTRRFDRRELTDYLGLCRQKAIDVIAAETVETLQGPSGFEWLRFSRAEAHVYNIRHVQHHTAQLAAYLRRIDPTIELRWVGSGWK